VSLCCPIPSEKCNEVVLQTQEHRNRCRLTRPNAEMRIEEYELFRSGHAKALMDEAGFTTLLKRSLVSSESGRGER
jgi:hypothetical protein